MKYAHYLEVNSTVQTARHFLHLGNEVAYEDVMIQGINESLTSEDKEFLIVAGKSDGYSFRQFGLRSK